MVMYRTWLPRSTRSLREPSSSSLRQSSSAPGPLEARRRSSKRRYAGAATVCVDHIAHDAGPLLSQRQASLRGHEVPWSPPTTELDKYGAELPSWLTKALNSLELQSKSSRQWAPEQDRETVRLGKKLTSCQTLTEIRELVARSKCSLQDPNCSRSAFRQLCRLQPDMPIVIEFLADRTTNPPLARNLSFLMNNLENVFDMREKSQFWCWKASTDLGTWLCNEARLGSLTEGELRELLRDVSIPHGFTPSTVQQFFIKAIHNLGVGLCDSMIRPIHELQPVTVRCLVRALASSSYLNAQNPNRGLASKVIRRACRAEPRRVDDLTRLFIRTFLDRARGVSNFHRVLEDLLSIVGKHVRSRMPPLLDYFFAMQSASGLHHEWLHYCLGTPKISNIVSQETWARYMAPTEMKIRIPKPSFFGDYVKSLEPRAACKHIFATWLLPITGPLNPSVRIRGSAYASSEELTSIAMGAIEQSDADPTRIAHLGLLDLALDISPNLASRLAEHFFATFGTSSSLNTLYLIARHSQCLKIHLSEETVEMAVNLLAIQYPRQALSLFMNDERLHLDHSPALIAAVIASPSIPTEVLIPLISRRAYFRSHEAKLKPSKRNLALVHSLAAMLAESTSSAISRLALISRVLDMFEDLPAVYTESMRHSLLRSEIIMPLRRGERLRPATRMKTLAIIAGTEGASVCRKLELLLASWEARLPREGAHAFMDVGTDNVYRYE